MNITKTIAIAITSLLIAPAAFANTPRRPAAAPSTSQKAQRLLDKFDANDDHMLDAGELEAMIEFRAQRKTRHKSRALKRFDSDKDGKLDESERAAMRAKRAQRRAQVIQRFDANGNGALDPPEKQAARQARAQKRFDGLLSRFDSDKDGALAWTEIASHVQSAGQGPGAGQGKHKKAKKLRKLFRRADTNNDKVLTRAEFEQAMKTLMHKRGGHRGHGGPGTYQQF